MTTMADLFPGNMGRITMTRVILRLRMPELAKMDKSAPLKPDLVAKLKKTIRDVQRG